MDDLDAALAAVDAAGGTGSQAGFVGEGAAECTDDQGGLFLLRER